MGSQKKYRDEDIALRKILEGTASHSGKDFFHALVKNLSEVLHTKGAWVTEFLPEEEKLRALSFWMNGHYIDNYEFYISGTPCERVVKKQQLFHISKNIIELYPDDPDLKAFGAVSYLGAPLIDQDGTILGNLAVLHTQPMPEEARNVALFRIFADRAATELRRIKVEKQLQERTKELQREYQRKTDELADARELQLNMLPKQLSGFMEYHFSFSMKTASEVGGDYYDYHLGKDRTLTFGIGDATGHGLKAGIMVTAMKLIFSEHAGDDDLTQFLKRASRSISLMGFRKLYMAFAIGRLYGDNKLELAGAGMPAVLIYRAENKSVERIPLKGMPLGTTVSYPYQKSETYVNPGDIVILMTDGLAELFDPENKMFGYEKIEQVLSDMANSTPDRMIDRFHRESETWLKGNAQNDDMTFFVFKRNLPVLKSDSLPAVESLPLL